MRRLTYLSIAATELTEVAQRFEREQEGQPLSNRSRQSINCVAGDWRLGRNAGENVIHFLPVNSLGAR